jgi:hypothetical protein
LSIWQFFPATGDRRLKTFPMPYLLYCMTEPAATPPPAGVHGARVESLDVSGLRCLYSVVESIGGDAEVLKRDALDFHKVNRSLFEAVGIIPFRFPTTLDSLAQVDAYIREHAQFYDAALGNFRGKVQMELRFRPAEVAAGEVSTGTGYLKTRAQKARQVEDAVSMCRIAINQEVIDWRQRESSHGVRCFALVKREAAIRVQEQIKWIRLDGGVTATLSGPWPPTEFLPVLND